MSPSLSTEARRRWRNGEGGTREFDGVAFVHHSNPGHFAGLARWVRRMPMRLQCALNRHLINLSGWRSERGTAEGFRAACRETGLSCILQEKIVWLHGRMPIDTLSIITRPGSRHDQPYHRWNNLSFMAEAKRALAHSDSALDSTNEA